MIAGVTLILIAVSIFSYFQYTYHRNLLISSLQPELSDVIKGSLKHAMLTQDLEEIRKIMENLTGQERVKSVFILNKRGEIRIASEERTIGQMLNQQDPTCQICHRLEPENRGRRVLFTAEGGERVLRTVNPIANEPECHGCHNPADRLNGILITDFSMADIDRQLAADLRGIFLLLMGAIIVTGLTLNFMMNRMVVGRLGKFVQAMKSFGKGNFNQRVEVEGEDEIGQLAMTFNQMAEGLKEKASLEEEIREQTERLSTLHSITATVSQSLKLEEILNRGLRKILQVMELEAGEIRLLDSGTLTLRASVGSAPDFLEEEERVEMGECVCGLASYSGEAIVIEDIPTDPRISRLGCKHQGFHSVVCVPLRAKERVLGVFTVHARRPHSFTPQDVELLTAIGNQLSVAIENAQLYEELQQREVLRGQLLEKVIAAQEEERMRIARELHDEFAQALTALTMSVEAAERILPPEMEKVKEQLAITKTLTVRTLEETYDLILDLRPAALDDLGLVPAIRWYVESHLEEKGIEVDLETKGIKARLPAKVETALFRVIQEALNNVVKHAKATHVKICLEVENSLFKGTIEDDGRGFDVEAVWQSEDKTRGLGLLGMRERVTLCGGTLDIRSQPGQGTKLYVSVPIDEGWKDESGREN
ncbi:MAG: GAF domain-containing protein [Anaerolineae bacterium]